MEGARTEVNSIHVEFFTEQQWVSKRYFYLKVIINVYNIISEG